MQEIESTGENNSKPLDLVGQSGLARLLDVSKQRVQQLKDAGVLPTPHGIVDDAYMVWEREEAERFALERNTALGKISLEE